MACPAAKLESYRIQVAPRLLGVAAVALACTLHLGTTLPAIAATYHVDNTNPGCSNTGPGSAAIPYCTITAAAGQHPGAGNTILVLAGTYREQVSIPAAGASGSPFVIQAAGPSVTVDGADDFTGAAQWSQVSGDVWLAGGVTWLPKQVFADGARLTAATVAPASMPARTFQYVAGSGLYVNAGGGNPAGHGALVGRRLYGFTMSGKSWVSIRGFTVTHAEDKGILVQGGSHQCEITDNRTTLNFKYGIQVAASNGCLVARNASWGNGGHGIALTAGSSGCTIEDNESYLNADPAVRVANGLHLFGAPSNLIQRNRFHDNQDSGEHIQSSSNDCVSLQNRSWNNGDHGYDHLGATGALHVGDVAYGNSRDGFSVEGNSSGTRIYNCIMVDNGLTTGDFDLWVDSASSIGFVSNYNIIWNSTSQPPVKYIVFTPYSSVADYSAASGQDAQSFEMDPQFVNPAAGDFHLQPGSPAIDNASSAVPSWPATDANGLPRLDDPATPDAGAGPVGFADRGALEFPPTVLTLLPASGTAPLTVTADATGSMGQDGTVASYRFDFGDGAVVGPQPGPTAVHTYSAGEWTATVTVTDGSGVTGTATAAAIATTPTINSVDQRVAAGPDDAEEAAGGKSVVNNTDLDLVYDKSNQTVGMRWNGVAIPRNAIINAAYVQFTAKDSRSEATSLTIRGQAADNAPTFTTANNNVSARPRTAASTIWTPAAWIRNQAGADQRTTDLRAIVEEIVSRPGWAGGNALALIVTGTGRRTAWAQEGNAAAAPLLHVEYTPNFPPFARLSIRQVAAPPLTISADASASTDTDPAPIGSYRFDFGDGSPPVTTGAPTAVAQHTYATPGIYTVTLTATDTRGLASAPVTASITVNGAPTARLSVAQLLTPPLTVRVDASASTDPDPMPIASYRFDFGDGSPAITTMVPTAIAQHAYSAAGTYTITVRVTDLGGLTSAPATASITVDAPPTARLSVAQAPSPPLTVNANGSASTDADATPIASYRFDFGDGSPPVTTTTPTATAQHAYAAPGNYTVTLIATDTGGFISNPSTANITVNSAPTARLSVTQPLTPPLTVTADASASTDPDPMPIASYRFNFGDGSPAITTTAPTALAQHAYSAPGTYTVTLTVTDTGGLTSAPATTSIAVDAPPTARLSMAQAPSPPLTAIADASASTDADATPIASYRFDFGDGSPQVTTSAPTAAAQHTYAASGIYTVTLIATDTGGYASAPATASLTVNGAPTARLSVTQPLTPPLTVTANASASTDPDPMPIASFRFDFGDGSPPVTTTVPTATAQHTYAAPGAYTLTLTATDTGGLTSAPATASFAVDAPPTARLTVTPVAIPLLSVLADASASTDADATPIASYRFDFGDGSLPVTTVAPTASAQHIYAAAGTYTVTVIATDSGGYSSGPASASVAVTAALNLRVAASSDDAEESATGKTNISNNDLELVYDRSNQTVGMRWAALPIPPRATISAAWIEFSARESQSEATSLTIRGQAADNAPAFTNGNNNVSARLRTAASGSWAPPAWTAGQAGSNQRTPDLTAVIQEIVNRPGWASGNALAIIVTGTGHRTAWSYDGNSAAGPLLHIEIASQEAPPVARLSATQVASPALTVLADGSASTGGSAAIASYRFVFGDGSPAVTTTSPTATAQHTYAASGTYNVTLTVTDLGGRISSPATASITVAPDNPPVARLAVTQAATPPLTVTANASASTDTDATPIASYRFDFGDGSAAVTTTAPATTAQHTYAASGTYTVTLLVTDSGGLTSAPATASITVNPPASDSPPVARLAVTQPANPPLTVAADASASTDADATPIASYRFDFGDGTATVTTAAPNAAAQHTYAASGTYTVTLLVTDTGGLTSSPATASITFGGATTIDRRIASSLDDAEEGAGGAMYLNSSDLELVTDGSTIQTVGMRWSGVTIPQGAHITAAYIQFAAKEAQSETTPLTMRAQAADDAGSFGSSVGNISTRPLTTAVALWSPVAWVAAEAGANQRTPDLSAVLQEIVNRPGWASGHALAIIVTGTGHRTAWAYEGNAAAAPLLHVEYTTGASPPMSMRATLEAPPATKPRLLSLSSAYPNPAASQVSFRLELPEQASVRWTIFDVQGRALWGEERMFEAGRADLSWNGRAANGAHAGSGVYFARVRTGERVFVRRFVRL